jgi:signal transduction histidine kinase
LNITIADNGLGINFENLRRFGNGLKNMRARLANINGSLDISNNNGTVAIFEVSL